MPKKVWAVSEGEYSDYSVRCLFEQEEDAKAHCEARKRQEKWGGAFVESFILYERGKQPELIGFVTLQGIVKEDGSYEGPPDPFWQTLWEAGEYTSPPPPNRPIGRTHTAPAYGRGLRVIVQARDLEKAKKAFYDRVAQAKTMVPVPLGEEINVEDEFKF